MFASSKSSLRSAKRVIISAAALTTAFGIGAGTAVALPVSPDLQSLSQSVRDLKLPEISTLDSGDLAPELSEVLDSSSVKLPDSVVALINENFKFAENNKQVADKVKTQLLNAIDSLPLPAAQKAEATRVVNEIFGLLGGQDEPSQPEPAPAPAPQPEQKPRPEPRPEPNNPCPPSARACVDLANQKTWLQENGNITYGPVPMSSGMPGYETTRGHLSVTRKVRDEWSRPSNGPMPFSVYFTNDGEAFHEGSVNQMSHGCIHLNHDDAVKYFDTLQVGDGVYIW